MASAFKELPGLRGLLSDVPEATHLRNVLSRNSGQDVRLRPFLNKMEDNFEVPVSHAVQLAMMQAKQLVPYMNGMKYVQQHQARMVGNLVVNTFERAAKGDVKAIEALGKYGLESHIVGRIRADIAAHGMDTAKWSASTWDDVRAPLTKMMDDAVLRARTGEIPAFAQFSSTGKFLFTFRSFTLTAHNKVLAGTMNKDGFGGLGLILLYQYPLTVAMTATANTLSGKKPMTDEQLVKKAFNQMGALGLAGEAVGIALQQRNQFGSPGTIGLDSAIKVLGAIGAGDGVKISQAVVGATPLLGIALPVKAIMNNIKE
jgi:hypothetical protein